MPAGMGVAGALWLTVVLVGGPLTALRRQVDPGEVPRRAVYLSASFTLWFFGAITAVIAVWEGTPARTLGLRPLGVVAFAAWSAGTLVLCLGPLIALLALQARRGGREPALVARLMPQDGTETRLFLLLSLSAGICEEWVFRGFALGLLTGLTGSAWIAAVLQAASFGAAHAYQSVWGLARATVLGFLLCLPPILAGSLWPSATAHFLVDALAGIWIWPLFRDLLTP